MIGLLVDAERAAPSLLGCRLVRSTPAGERIGIIVETEAYLPEDPACHACAGPTERNAAMFKRAGTAYVYRIHRSYCFNVVTGAEGSGQAVLVRAIEPVLGVASMQRARQRATVGSTRPHGVALTNGPGKLCQALDIDLDLDGVNLIAEADRLVCASLRLLPRDTPAPIVERTARIGISKARELPLRFVIRGNRWLSQST
ncbi:MAG: DNA-3-methyladenine glycosylase [Candidatus Binatia bacterium]